MPALTPTDHHATITWIGIVPPDGDGIASVALTQIAVGFDGPAGDAHAGTTRPSCSRVTAQHPKGTTIRNVRQVTIVSAEEMAAIAAEIGLDRLAPEDLGATFVVEGIADFSHVPPSSRLQAEDGTTLVVDMENRPCHLPGREIETRHPGKGGAFKSAARNRRGVTAWVEREGTLRIGARLRLHIPDQPAWAGNMPA